MDGGSVSALRFAQCPRLSSEWSLSPLRGHEVGVGRHEHAPSGMSLWWTGGATATDAAATAADMG